MSTSPTDGVGVILAERRLLGDIVDRGRGVAEIVFMERKQGFASFFWHLYSFMVGISTELDSQASLSSLAISLFQTSIVAPHH